MAGRITDELRRATRSYSQLHPVESAGAERTEEQRAAMGPFGWLSLALLIALAMGGWWLVQRLQADSKLQDCVMSGRRNCAPVDATSGSGR